MERLWFGGSTLRQDDVKEEFLRASDNRCALPLCLVSVCDWQFSLASTYPPALESLELNGAGAS